MTHLKTLAGTSRQQSAADAHSRGLSSVARQRPLLVYFGLAYLTSWALLLPLALSSRGV